MVTNQHLVLGEAATLVEVNRGRYPHEPAGSWHKQGPAMPCYWLQTPQNQTEQNG